MLGTKNGVLTIPNCLRGSASRHARSCITFAHGQLCNFTRCVSGGCGNFVQKVLFISVCLPPDQAVQSNSHRIKTGVEDTLSIVVCFCRIPFIFTTTKISLSVHYACYCSTVSTIPLCYYTVSAIIALKPVKVGCLRDHLCRPASGSDDTSKLSDNLPRGKPQNSLSLILLKLQSIN